MPLSLAWQAVGDIYVQLLKTRTPLRLLVCTGRQADVRASLEREPVPPRHAVKMLGFVKDAQPTPGGMPTLLRCADLFVRHRPTHRTRRPSLRCAAAQCFPPPVLPGLTLVFAR